jgi:ABC-type glycerol-3-phosphate transport system permease component
VIFSLQDRHLGRPVQFLGLQNYISLATDSMSGPALRNTIGLVMIRLLVVGIVWWVLRAAWLKQRRVPTWLVLVAVAPLPFFSPVGSAVCWQFLGRPEIGLLGRIISWYRPSDAWLLLLIVDGLHTLAVASAGGLLAYALGQKRWKVSRHPSPAVLNAVRNVMLVIAAAGALQSLIWGLVITQGNFGTVTLLLATYQLQYKYASFGYGSAYATVVLVALIGLAVILWKMTKAPFLRLVPQPLDTAPDPEDRAVSSWGLRLLGLLPGVVILLPYIWLLWLLLARPEAIAPQRPVLLRESWGRPLVNSLVPGLAVWIVQLPVALLTAYAVSLRRLPGKATNRVLGLLFVVAAIVSTGVISAPLYSGGAALGLINTTWASVLPVFTSGAAVILFAQIFKSLAPRLAQARARGETEARIFRRDILPAAWPLVLLVGVASTWWASQRILWPLLVLVAPERWPAGLWAYQILQYTGISVEAGTSALLSVFPLGIPFAVALVFLVRVILRRMALVAGDE